MKVRSGKNGKEKKHIKKTKVIDALEKSGTSLLFFGNYLELVRRSLHHLELVRSNGFLSLDYPGLHCSL